MPTHNDFLSIMQERGFLHQCTDLTGLEAAMKQPVTAYIGFDCTASSLHVGSLMQIMVLRWLQKCGHKPIVLMGGGTTKVGDPSGKDEARKLLDDAAIQSNMNGIKQVFKKYLSFEGEGGNALMINNDDWLAKLNYIEFLRDYGKFFSVNRMLGMDSVKLRLEREQYLSFLEFNYMVLQSYDFLTLSRLHNCKLQIGGSDQWGNIVMGVALQHSVKVEEQKRTTEGKAEVERTHRAIGKTAEETNTKFQKVRGEWQEKYGVFGLTTPLITTSSGAKMGKTASGAVWLNADMLPAYDYWQYWRNTEDADVERFLKFFTELSLEEIAKITSDKSGAGINEAKKILANEATALCHGRQAAEEAAETARKTFEEGGMGGNLPEITVSAYEINKCSEGALLRTLLIKAGFAESNGEAKKLIMGGGIRLNDQVVSEVNRLLTLEDFVSVTAKLSKGKKHHARIVLT